MAVLPRPGSTVSLDRRILLVCQPATSPPAARTFLALAREHLAGL